MASTTQYKCLRCTGLFTARTADRARGWARYCSKSCKAIKQEQRTGQYAAFKDRADSYDADMDGAEDQSWDSHKDWL